MSAILSRFILKLIGWKIVKQNIKEKSYVIVAAPHTSNWDFVIARLGVSSVGIPQKVLMKKEMFIFPFNYLFKALGAMPIDRKASLKMVDYIIELFKEKDDFIFSISPEGTRSYVEKWKTGFYHIATKANVPLVFGRLDYKKKVLEFSSAFYPTGDFEEDFRAIVKHYNGAKGFYPENYNPKPANITY